MVKSARKKFERRKNLSLWIIIAVIIIIIGFAIYIKTYRANLSPSISNNNAGPVPVILCGPGSDINCQGSSVGATCGRGSYQSCQAVGGGQNPACSCKAIMLSCGAFCEDRNGRAIGVCPTECGACTTFNGAIGQEKKCFPNI